MGETEETVSVNRRALSAVLESVEAAIDHVSEAQAKHDNSVGRRSRKNQYWGSVLDSDLSILQKSAEVLRKVLGLE